MRIVKGIICEKGLGHFSQRIARYPDVFRNATGEDLVPGTINIQVGGPIPIREQFRICGTDIGEPDQDLLFEVCRVNGIWAYRIRPYNLVTGAGGWGDHILEVSSKDTIPNVTPHSEATIALFRDDIPWHQ
jgi:hypothetical protein